MTTRRRKDAPTPLSQRQRDILKVLAPVLEGKRSPVEAARLRGISPRQVRRLLVQVRSGGDTAIRHGRRGRPSHRAADAQRRRRVLKEYRSHFDDFGPTFAQEKRAERGLHVGVETLRGWLIEEGLWQPRRRRERRRKKRPRRDCFGELVQRDTSIHDWLEGRGEAMVLVNMIDDATSRVLAGFYQGETVEAPFDLLGQGLRKYGRPVALYTDRDRIFEYQSKGRGDPDGLTRLGRALRERDVGLILARSPQAKGRVERFFETAQDRWVKEMRLAGVLTPAQANELAQARLIGEFNRRFAVAPTSAADAHRPLGGAYHLAAILSVQHQRVVGNDDTVRFESRTCQIDRPIHPGLRKGRVVIELRLDGSRALRFQDKYLNYHEVGGGGRTDAPGGSAPRPPGVYRLSGRRGRGRERLRPPVRGPAALAYSRPPDARVALLQSPILPSAGPRIPGRGRGAQPQITPGVKASRACETWLSPGGSGSPAPGCRRP